MTSSPWIRAFRTSAKLDIILTNDKMCFIFGANVKGIPKRENPVLKMSSQVIEILQIICNKNDQPILSSDGKVMCHVKNNDGLIMTVGVDSDDIQYLLPNSAENETENLNISASTSTDNVGSLDVHWNDDQSKFLLDQYHECLSQVGPMKKFRSKKKMWEQISTNINDTFKTCRTPTQVENRFKTILKRKKAAVDNNHTSGSKRLRIEYEDELNKISAVDDSIHPEVMKDQSNTVNKKDTNEKEPQKNKNTLLEYFKTVNEEKSKDKQKRHQEREESKDRRHKEKLDLLRELFKES